MSNFAQRSLEACFPDRVSVSQVRLYRPLRSWIGAAVLCLFILMTAAVVQVFPGL